MKLKIGSKVILLRDMLGEKSGSVGYVYEMYPHPEETDRFGVSVIFSCGGYDGFSPMEQDLFLEYLSDDPHYSNYVFRNVMQVYRDFQHDYWRFE